MNRWVEEVQSVRSFTWSHTIADERDFLVEWLTRVRVAFRVDFSVATLLLKTRKLETTAPANLSRLPYVSAFLNGFFEEFRPSASPTVVEDNKLRWGFRSLVVASISPTGQSPAGIVAVGDSSRYTFTAPESFQFQRIAEELGMVLRRSVARKTFYRKKLLLELAEEIDFAVPDKILPSIARRTGGELGADLCVIRLTGRDGRLKVVAPDPNPAGCIEHRLSVHHRELTPLLFKKKPSIEIANLHQPASRPAFRAYLGTRLLSKSGKLIGLFEIYSFAPRKFAIEDISFLEEIAKVVSLILARAR
jgi:hypothetical protein